LKLVTQDFDRAGEPATLDEVCNWNPAARDGTVLAFVIDLDHFKGFMTAMVTSPATNA
jgi:hypothetical protein